MARDQPADTLRLPNSMRNQVRKSLVKSKEMLPVALFRGTTGNRGRSTVSRSRRQTLHRRRRTTSPMRLPTRSTSNAVDPQVQTKPSGCESLLLISLLKSSFHVIWNRGRRLLDLALLPCRLQHRPAFARRDHAADDAIEPVVIDARLLLPLVNLFALG